MTDARRRRLAMVTLTLSVLGAAAWTAGSSAALASAGEGNSQPPSGLLLTGSNETHTGALTAAPSR